MLHDLERVDNINKENENDMTALYYAIVKAPDAAAAVKLIMDCRHDPTNHTTGLHSTHGKSPLLCAAYHGGIESAKLLLEHGANLHGTFRGMNAMHCAAETGHAPFVKWLLDNGGGHDMMLSQNCNGETPLNLAIYYLGDWGAEANQRVINLLLQAYKDIIVTQEGNICLH